VVAEIVLLFEIGRTTIGLPQLQELFQEGGMLRFLPLDLDQLNEFAALASIHERRRDWPATL